MEPGANDVCGDPLMAYKTSASRSSCMERSNTRLFQELQLPPWSH